VLIGAGIFFGFGAIMWAAALPPDDHPVLTMLAAVLAVAGAWWIGSRIHAFADRRLRRAR
jgi:hypothetical protein